MSDSIAQTGACIATEAPLLEQTKCRHTYASPVGLVLLWQIACSVSLLSTRVVASPIQIAVTGWMLVRDGTLPFNLGVSLLRAGSSLGLIDIQAIQIMAAAR
ncbi:ABC transporter permease [Acetobacter senegalensis]|uniref:hypothetical protein n=1 Tax=Acetobacter senegalensis TaxID=446692 RepID=UPI001EDC72FC|nr:hypothetical protein [Acetobacter senegalensis]